MSTKKGFINIFVLIILAYHLIFITNVCAKEISAAIYSDILALIDFLPIPSYNVNGTTYIVAEDLNCYGFDVNWSSADRTLHILRNKEKPYYDLTGEVKFVNYEEYPTLKIAHHISDSNIKTYLGDTEIPSFNIGGRTIISMEELSRYGYLNWNQKFIDFRDYPKNNPEAKMNFAFVENGRTLSLHMTYFDIESAFENLPSDETNEIPQTIYRKDSKDMIARKENFSGQIKDEKRDGLGKLYILHAEGNGMVVEYMGSFKNNAYSGKGLRISYDTTALGMRMGMSATLQIGNFEQSSLNGFGIKCDPNSSGRRREYGIYENDKLLPDSAALYPNSKYYDEVVSGTKHMIHTY